MTELRIGAPNEKQRRFLLDRHRHIAYEIGRAHV